MESDGVEKPLFHKNKLMVQRHFLLKKLAECANQIKRIDEQLKAI